MGEGEDDGTYRVSQNKFEIEFFEVWQPWALSGRFGGSGHFLDIFGHSRHYWALLGTLGQKVPRIAKPQKILSETCFGTPCTTTHPKRIIYQTFITNQGPERCHINSHHFDQTKTIFKMSNIE